MSDEPEFTTDWLTPHLHLWRRFLGPIAGQPNVHALEIGAFEGRSTRWLLEHVLTGAGSTITVVDTFQGSPEHVAEGRDLSALFARFWRNIAPFRDRVEVRQQSSRVALPELITECAEDGADAWRYDFAYIDGSHHADDVLFDGTHALPLLKVGGLLCFDDYAGWRFTDEDGAVYCPRDGIRAFLAAHEGQAEVVGEAYQLWCRRAR